MADCEPQRSWIPDSREDLTEDWVRSLLVTHFGDGVRVKNFHVRDSPETVDHCCELVVEFDCRFDAPESRQASPPPISSFLEEGLIFTACVDEEEKDASTEDHTVIQELDSFTLPGDDGAAEEVIELLVTGDDNPDGAFAGGRRPSFYISDSDEEAEAPLPALVSYPASGVPSPRAPSPADSDSDDQTPDKHLVWKVRLPTSDPLAELLCVDGRGIDRELTLFSLVAPRMAALSVPSCVYSEQDCGNSRRWVLVTEDPRLSGLPSLDPRKPLSHAAVKSVVDAIATNAALFLMLRRQLEAQGKQLGDEYEALRPSDLEMGRHPLAVDHAGQCLREVAQILSQRRPDLSNWLLSKAPSAMSSFLRLSEVDSELTIPVNGFCCPQNLHLGDEGVVMLDWHLFRLAGLTFDLAHLLLTAVPFDVRRQMTGEYLNDFTRRIREKLEEWNEPPFVALTEDRVKRDYKKSQGAAFFWAATDLCRGLGRMPSGSSAKRRTSDGKDLAEATAGLGIRDQRARETRDPGESETSASVCQTEDNFSQRCSVGYSDRQSNVNSDVLSIPREQVPPPDSSFDVGQTSSGEAVKHGVQNDGYASDDTELDLREVLIQRLQEMVLEIKDADVL